MDRVINIKVGGNHLSKDNKNAGVKGEANVTNLRITFDESWKGYAKTVTFFDAHGNNPVKRIETTDLIEDITKDALTYITPIPKEPLAIAGEMTFVIDGYKDGKRMRSISDTLVVKDAPMTDNAGEPTDPIPTPDEQIQKQIDAIINTIQNAAISEKNAKKSEELALNYKNETEQYADMCEKYSESANLAVGKVPYVGDNGNWFAWNGYDEKFYDTGVRAQAGSEVYLGENPPDDADVWIDPNGEESYNPTKTSELTNDSGYITEKDVPVEAAEGLYSIIGKEEGNRVNRADGRANIAIGHKNKTYQRDSAAFGGGNQAGFHETEGGTVYRYKGADRIPMSFPSFNDYFWDSATNTPKNGGRGKDAYGNILDSAGSTYIASYGTVTVVGMSNVGLARASFTWGEESLNAAPWAVVGGRSNWNKENGLYSDIGGYWNTNNGKYNFMRGYKLTSYSKTTSKDYNNCTLLGESLYPSNDNCTVVGKYNGSKSNSQYELMFCVGGGSEAEGGKNVLEVYSNGVVRVPKEPAYDHDVVNKAYLDKVLGVIENGSY